MMDLVELTKRNAAAALRETFNAWDSAVMSKRLYEAAGIPFVPDSVTDKLNEARLCLEVAAEELARVKT